MKTMKTLARLCTVLLLVFAVTGCAHRTILRVNTVTPPSAIAVVPPSDPDATAVVGTQTTRPGLAEVKPVGVPSDPNKPAPPPIGSGEGKKGFPAVDPSTGLVNGQPVFGPQYYKTADMKTLGRIWNNTPYPVTVHLPPEAEVLRVRSASLLYSDVRGQYWDTSDAWIHFDFLTFKAGDSENWWIRLPAGRWRIVYDYTVGAQDQRGLATIISDFTLADGICRGIIVDWSLELGTQYCRQ